MSELCSIVRLVRQLDASYMTHAFIAGEYSAFAMQSAHVLRTNDANACGRRMSSLTNPIIVHSLIVANSLHAIGVFDWHV